MGEKIAVGDYGEMSFILKAKNLLYKKEKIGEPYIIAGHIGRVRVIEADRTHLWVVDHDGQEFNVPRSNVRYFEKCEKPEDVIIEERLEAMSFN